MKQSCRGRVLWLLLGPSMTSTAWVWVRPTMRYRLSEYVSPSIQVTRFTSRRYPHVSYSHAKDHRSLHSTARDTAPSNNEPYAGKYQELMDASKLSLAPMMEYTDRHFRYMVRLLSSRTLLYTEMVAANAIAHERRRSLDAYSLEHGDEINDPQQHSMARERYNDQYLKRYLGQARHQHSTENDDTRCHEGPCVLQLGGSDPEPMHEAAQTVMDLTRRGHCNYTALNLNCGCPSPKVAGKGCFGAALMDEPDRVARLCRALSDGTGGALPVSVKCRIGTDTDHAFQLGPPAVDPDLLYDTLGRFIDTVASDGIVTDFSVHARIAVLQKSYSPADNRHIPPLQYKLVRRLTTDFPHLTFTLNGGVTSMAQVQAELAAAPRLKGVMVGRAWAADPWSFAMADSLVYGEAWSDTKNRLQILQDYGRHADWEEANGEPDKIRRFITKAVSPLFAGEPNSKRYRIALDEIASHPKKLKAEGKSMVGQPPVSELILAAATQHLDRETLLRTPQESYERRMQAEERRSQLFVGTSTTSNSTSQTPIEEWQTLRKEAVAQEASVYEDLLAG